MWLSQSDPKLPWQSEDLDLGLPDPSPILLRLHHMTPWNVSMNPLVAANMYAPVQDQCGEGGRLKSLNHAVVLIRHLLSSFWNLPLQFVLQSIWADFLVCISLHTFPTAICDKAPRIWLFCNSFTKHWVQIRGEIVMSIHLYHGVDPALRAKVSPL